MGEDVLLRTLYLRPKAGTKRRKLALLQGCGPLSSQYFVVRDYTPEFSFVSTTIIIATAD